VKECNQCGKCCEIYADGGLSATSEELDWWEAHRPDIYRYVANGKIWMDPDSATALKRCPWLEQLADNGKYVCSIYHDRPDDCRDYPVLVSDMIRDGCEMIEVQDLTDLDKTQASLNKTRV
jgi:Fe-S-cluster containining protein